MASSVRLLGGLAIAHDDQQLLLSGQRQACLLAVLLLNHGRTVPRASLAAWAWPDDPPATVDRQIANYVSGLRRRLAPLGDALRLSAKSPGFTATPAPDLLDTDRFLRLVDQAGDARAGHEHEIAADRLREALSLWTGRPLDGLDTPYLHAKAADLSKRHRDAVLLLATIEREAGRATRSIDLLRELVREQRQDEAAVVALVHALMTVGEHVEAAEAATRTTQALIRRGHTPSPALRQAHSDALAGRTHRARRLDTPSRSADPWGRPTTPGRQLPPDTGAFTGRAEEIARIQQLADQAPAAGTGGTPTVCTIDGMGGMGKTSLAVHCAHLLADRFPDGQLHLELHTHKAGAPPRTVSDALGLALSCLGLPPQAIPPGADARAARYRAALAGTRTLVTLDDVADESQVRALLPGSAGCLVLVTSRRRLKGLDDAHSLSLDSLPPHDALALFRATSGPGPRPAQEPLLAELVELCGGLPLALRITASLVRHRRAAGLRDVLAELRENQDDLEAFDDGSRNLASTFDLSYRRLQPVARTLFARLGQVPGPDIDPHGAAALLGTPTKTARRLLRDLVDRHLLAETAPGRFRLHDLLREFARGRSEAEESAEVVDAALDRLFDHYQRAARDADRHIRMIPDGPQADGAPGGASGADPGRGTMFADRRAAEAWLSDEIENIVAAARHAARRQDPRHAVSLPLAIAAHLYHHGPWPRALELLTRAADLAAPDQAPRARAAALLALGPLRQLMGDAAGAVEALTDAQELNRVAGDPYGEANVLTELARVSLHAADYGAAEKSCDLALAQYRRLDCTLGQANVLSVRGRARQLTGAYLDALDDARHSLDLYRAAGNRVGQARAHGQLGAVLVLTGDHRAATRELNRSLALCRRLGHPLEQVTTLVSLAALRRRSGDHTGALRVSSRATALADALGSGIARAAALTERGAARGLTGDHAGAEADFAEALHLYRRLDKGNGQAIAHVRRGTARRHQGDHAGSLAQHRIALDLLRRAGERGDEAWALTHYAAALRDAGDTAGSLHAFRHALALNRALHRPAEAAAALEGIGRIRLSSDAPRVGTACLTAAARIYRALGMRPALRRVESHLACAKPVLGL